MASNEEWTVAKRKKKKVPDKPPQTSPHVTRKTLVQNRIAHPMAKPNKPVTEFTREYNLRPRNTSPRRDRERNSDFFRKHGSKRDSDIQQMDLPNKPTNKSSFQRDKTQPGLIKRPGIIISPQIPKKTKKSKKKNTNAHYLRSVNEVSLNLSDVLKEVPKTKEKTKISTGVTVRTQPRSVPKSTFSPRNVLDSTAPMVRRGKERATPKNKKHTKLKRLVLEERRLIKLQKDLRKQPNFEDFKGDMESLILLEIDKKQSALPEITITFVDSELNEHEAPAPEYTNVNVENELQNNTCNSEATPDNVEHTDTPEVSENAIETEEINSISNPEPAKVEIETFQVSFIGEGLPGMHTKKFREYCYQMPDKEVDELTTKLLYELMKLQARQHDMNKIKSKGKKRLVFGFHEVTKHLHVQNLKCIVIARDLERSKAIGGLEHQITSICSQCKHQNVQVVFALTKHTLSFSVCKPKTIVSIVGILNYDGRQSIYKDLTALVVMKEREYFDRVREKRAKSLQPESKSLETNRDENENATESEETSKKSKNIKTQTGLQIKKFNQEDTHIPEFIPACYPPESAYVDLYQPPYMQPYGYYPVPVYPHQYYYTACQYGQYDQ